jgi:hypothetical protein
VEVGGIEPPLTPLLSPRLSLTLSLPLVASNSLMW